MGNDDAKKLVLARRAKFVAAALAGMAGVASACGGNTESDPQPCLSVQPDRDANPQPCLSIEESDATPQPCLEPLPPDASDDANADADAEPQPCLSPHPPDAGDGGDGG